MLSFVYETHVLGQIYMSSKYTRDSGVRGCTEGQRLNIAREYEQKYELAITYPIHLDKPTCNPLIRVSR